jgi:hypothetical protein
MEFLNAILKGVCGMRQRAAILIILIATLLAILIPSSGALSQTTTLGTFTCDDTNTWWPTGGGNVSCSTSPDGHTITWTITNVPRVENKSLQLGFSLAASADQHATITFDMDYKKRAVPASDDPTDPYLEQTDTSSSLMASMAASQFSIQIRSLSWPNLWIWYPAG